MEKEAAELRQAVESLWKRLDIPCEQQEKVLEKLESFRQEDIDIVSIMEHREWQLSWDRYCSLAQRGVTEIG